MAALLFQAAATHPLLKAKRKNPRVGKREVSQLWALGSGQTSEGSLGRAWTAGRQAARVSVEPSRSEERWLALRCRRQTLAKTAGPYLSESHDPLGAGLKISIPASRGGGIRGPF